MNARFPFSNLNFNASDLKPLNDLLASAFGGPRTTYPEKANTSKYTRDTPKDKGAFRNNPTLYYVTKNDEASTVLEVMLPGFMKEEVNISMEDRILTVSAKSEKYGEYTNLFELSNVEEIKDISASMKNGILELTVSYNIKEEPKSRVIKVEIGD